MKGGSETTLVLLMQRERRKNDMLSENRHEQKSVTRDVVAEEERLSHLTRK